MRTRGIAGQLKPIVPDRPGVTRFCNHIAPVVLWPGMVLAGRPVDVLGFRAVRIVLTFGEIPGETIGGGIKLRVQQAADPQGDFADEVPGTKVLFSGECPAHGLAWGCIEPARRFLRVALARTGTGPILAAVSLEFYRETPRQADDWPAPADELHSPPPADVPGFGGPLT